MKQLILLVIAIIFLLPLSKAQNGISVASFKELPMDMTARVTSPVIDQNGDVSALIRVVTTQTGFKWEAGILSIVKAEHKTGEYWLYVPYGSKKLTIMHPKLGVLRNYFYPVPIKKATVYEMILTTGTVETIIHDAEIQTQYLIFKSEPAQADVYIDDTIYIGQTPLDKEFPLGEYNYRISKSLYLTEAGKIVLDEADGRKEINAVLTPDFGSISLSSLPESGAEVFLDDKTTGKYTPCVLEEVPSGTHFISLRKQWYIPKKESVQIVAGQNLELRLQMKEAFANISINAENDADIYINDQYKAKANWNGRLEPGLYTLEARKKQYRTDSRKIQVISGEPQNITLSPTPITGDLKIASDPFDAEVFINGEKKGKTPLTLRDLLIGDYSLELRKELHANLKKTITVKEGEMTRYDFEMSNGQEVSIVSTPSGAELSIDGKPKGRTSKKLSLSYGEHRIRLSKENYNVLDTRFDVQPGKSNYSFKLISDKQALAQYNFKKYRRAKYIWMGVTAASAGAAAYFYLETQKDYDAYPDATQDATNLHENIDRNSKIWPAAAGVAGAGLVMTIIKSIQQKKARKQMNIAVVPVGDGAVFCLQIPIN